MQAECKQSKHMGIYNCHLLFLIFRASTQYNFRQQRYIYQNYYVYLRQAILTKQWNAIFLDEFFALFQNILHVVEL